MPPKRKKARELAQQYLKRGDPTGWFEDLYASANGDTGIIPWADLAPNPHLVSWLDRNPTVTTGGRSLSVGCGFGDDAEALFRRGFEVTAFDISPTVITWCAARFPDTRVNYVVQDLFASPPEWERRFDFVLEINTLQVFPFKYRARVMKQIARFVAPGGTLLVICRGREAQEPEGLMPWPLVKAEFEILKACGLNEVLFEDFLDEEDPPARRFRAAYGYS